MGKMIKKTSRIEKLREGAKMLRLFRSPLVIILVVSMATLGASWGYAAMYPSHPVPRSPLTLNDNSTGPVTKPPPSPPGAPCYNVSIGRAC